MSAATLADALRRHVPRDAREAADLAEILAFVARHRNPFDRAISEGHLTGSALVLSDAGDRVLLLFHLKLGRWLGRLRRLQGHLGVLFGVTKPG